MPPQQDLVIVVDDDAAVRQALRFALEQEGLEVRDYADGGELLAEAELPRHACLLIDQFMPAMSGVDLVRRLRRRHVRLPAILMTGRSSRELRESASRAGFACVLEKPLDDGALMDTIRSELAREIH
ncbi:FixJ family two-component response regulator [Methylopila jiangsuensis]|uniref:response regulator n=1 Tax=Methylopila jiangsuensis TaxID=586230 RepID=UPI0022F2B1E2|nr:response regulator [Methylopila jiangsuensis]MDR6286459.1 FixJ family two-component response regulator [Methylopila jiangsuensis]